MAEIRVMKQPSKPVREKREEALERLLLVACSILPEPEKLGVNGAAAQDLLHEAGFWLDYAPRGAKPDPTSAEFRLGQQAVTDRRAKWADTLDASGALVPVSSQPVVANGKAK